MKIVLATGGFDPLHSGHLKYLRAAKNLGDHLIVGVNSDAWLTRKKGRPFLPVWERVAVLNEIKTVNQVVFFDNEYDKDNSACEFIKDTLKLFKDDEIIFANGGDRTSSNIPEMQISDPRLSFVFGVGGEDKSNSSSWILEEWKSPKTQRPWGYYRVLYDNPGTKVKELTVMPGQKLTMQKHRERAEHWHVVNGMCDVYQQSDSGYQYPPRTLGVHQTITIPENGWHQLCNPYNYPCQLIEIQYGSYCGEDDIERKL